MDRFSRVRTAVPLLLVMILIGVPAFAQTDFSGEWANRNHEDSTERGGGPQLGDYLGIPVNEAGRMRAETSDVADWGLPEFQCRPHSGSYQWRAAGGVRFLKEIDPVSRELTAYHVGWVRSLDRAIYMDGRPHPPEYAPHTWSGFSTGKWDGNTLVVTTTHMKESYIRRNGVHFSDNTVMTEYIMRHGDFLTIVVILEDPIYLEEPFIQSSNYQLDVHTQLGFFPCTVIEENISREVPHFLPGKNQYLTEWATQNKIPLEAARGGKETIYPEFLLKLNKAPGAVRK